MISVENLGKKYWMSVGEQASYRSWREETVNKIKYLFNTGNYTPPKDFNFWALRNVDFKVGEGQVLGLIGRNGAGKSTLLKIISRITSPSEGKVVISGRVASLLEVGTGFHPELSGLENIFLGGSILGMKRKEIKSKLAQIIDFSGVEDFIHLPIKRYSSGMRVRLGFAVAAHLAAEVLLIDEVLAVGDAVFQKKCLSKIDDVAKGGKTILFVSHDLNAIRGLCNSCVVLEKGGVSFSGAVEDGIGHYLHQVLEGGEGRKLTTLLDESYEWIKSVELLSNGLLANQFKYQGNLQIKVQFNGKQALWSPILGIVIKDHKGHAIIGVNNEHYDKVIHQGRIREGNIKFEIPKLNLMPGNYFIDLFLGDKYGDKEIVRDLIRFEVKMDEFNLIAMRLDPKLNKVFYTDLNWSLED